jgi:hypothetical protein
MRKRSSFRIALDMAFERIALVSYTLAAALVVYVAFIYLQEIPAGQMLRAVEMEGVHMLEKERGRVKGVLDAERVVRDETNERLHFFKVKYTTFPEKHVTHVITARRGLQSTNTKDATFEGRRLRALRASGRSRRKEKAARGSPSTATPSASTTPPGRRSSSPTRR